MKADSFQPAADIEPDALKAAARWLDVAHACTLLAVDPMGLGGAVLKASAGPARDTWLAHLRGLFAPDKPVRRLPLTITQDRLLGGLDLAATLATGRRVAETGLLAASNGGLLVIPMAERLAPSTTRQISSALDHGVVQIERDGLSLRSVARFAVIACDEGLGPDEQLSDTLRDRLAFHLNLDGATADQLFEPEFSRAEIAAAAARLPTITITDDAIEALSATALALGISSVRAVLMAVAAARASASLAGNDQVSEQDLALAGRLLLAPRATRLPPSLPEDQDTDDDGDQHERDEPPEGPQDADQPDQASSQQATDLEDVVLQAVQAALPDDLLATLDANVRSQTKTASAGRTGSTRKTLRRGRPIGTRAGMPGSGHRLDIIATLTQAAPWQRIRKSERIAPSTAEPAPLIELRRDDFRIKRFAQNLSQTTIFVVDASGSAAFQRLGEAKGAVELLLADCYIRRDRVALLAFRGTTAELLLAPTRSLTRARRALAGLPGGGPTPIAAGLDLAREVADQVRRQDEIPLIVVLTDGGANIARDGTPGRPRAEADAIIAGQRLAATGPRCLVIDTATRPQLQARRIAAAMAAVYVPLPNADAQAISRAARALDNRSSPSKPGPPPR